MLRMEAWTSLYATIFLLLPRVTCQEAQLPSRSKSLICPALGNQCGLSRLGAAVPERGASGAPLQLGDMLEIKEKKTKKHRAATLNHAAWAAIDDWLPEKSRKTAVRSLPNRSWLRPPEIQHITLESALPFL